MTTYPSNQSNPQSAIPVYLGGADYVPSAANGNAQVKVGPGVFYGVGVNTAGTTSTAALYDGLSAPVTVTIAAPGVVTWPAHGLVAGSAIELTTSGALPTGLTAGTIVYVANDANLTANTFAVSDTKAHALAGTNQITTTGTQSGVQTGWNVTNQIGSYATTATGPVTVPFPNMGVAFTLGLILITAGAAAATINVFYR